MKPLTDEEFQEIKELYDGHPHIHIPPLIATVEALQSKLEGVKLALVDENNELHEEIEKLKQENSELKSRDFSNRPK